jgi:hypothetical protein
MLKHINFELHSGCFLGAKGRQRGRGLKGAQGRLATTILGVDKVCWAGPTVVLRMPHGPEDPVGCGGSIHTWSRKERSGGALGFQVVDRSLEL